MRLKAGFGLCALVTCVLCLIAFGHSTAQRVRNVSATVKENLVEIRYDLEGVSEFAGFNVQVFASYDNYSTPLKQLTGDAGERISAGSGKLIVWNPVGELKAFKGELQFEIRAKGIAAPVPLTLISPESGLRLKAGKTVQIRWKGGDPTETVRLQLMNGNDVREESVVANTGTATLRVPKKTQPGEYRIRLFVKEEEVLSPFCTLKKRTSPWVKIASIAVLTGTALVVLAVGGNDLPSPPEPN